MTTPSLRAFSRGRILGLALLAVSLTPKVQMEAQRPTLQRLDSLFAPLGGTDTPGCAVAFDSAGTRRFTSVFGRSDLERGTLNDTLTVFEAGSVSKQVTAAAVLLLARAGRLSLNDDVRRWIPELPAIGNVSVRQLLHHQSGWRDWRDLAEMSRWPSGTAMYTMADALLMFRRQRALNFAPGAEYAYSNSNYVIAAMLVERVTGETLAHFTRKAIFAPLGMRETRWRDDPTAVVRGRALPYAPTDSGRFALDQPFDAVIGAGGLLTTIPDLMRWLRNLDTEQVGGAGFTTAMEAVGVLHNGRATRYAMGLEIDSIGGERMVSHAGWTGGYVAWAGRLPARGVALGILCNASAVNTEDIGPVLMARLAGLRVAEPSHGTPRAAGPPAPTLRTAQRRAFVGAYRSDDANATIEIRLLGDTLTAWRGDVLHDRLIVTGTDQFRVPSQGWRLAFRRDRRGAVTGFDLGLPRTRQLPFVRER